jgi:phosphate transport system substrate-binding protein
MKMLKTLTAALGVAVLAGATAHAADLSGAGATFPAPIYAKWAETYRKDSGVGLNYQPIGSGGGIKQIKAKTVDFGASDKPLKVQELNESGLFQFPTVVGGVVPVVNIPGVAPGALKLNGAILADIYLGEIKRWNDPRIAQLNPGLRLPGLPVTVVHRSDGSGTSFLFTTYLSMKSAAWAGKVGGNDSVEWPVGQGGKGNDGVAAFVKQTVGSIGYVEYVYIQQNHMAFVDMQTRQGSFIAPTEGAFAAAASHGDWSHAPGYYLLLLDQPGEDAWPITGATFILMYKQQANAATGEGVLKFFDWAYKNGDGMAKSLSYVPLPEGVKAQIRKSWAMNIKGGNGQPVYVAH